VELRDDTAPDGAAAGPASGDELGDGAGPRARSPGSAGAGVRVLGGVLPAFVVLPSGGGADVDAVSHHTGHGRDLDHEASLPPTASPWSSVVVVDLEPSSGVGGGGARGTATDGGHMADPPAPFGDGAAEPPSPATGGPAAAGSGGGPPLPSPGLGGDEDCDGWVDDEDLTAAEARLGKLAADPSVSASAAAIGLAGGGGGGAAGAEEGGGILGRVTSFFGGVSSTASSLATAWARRNRPGPVGGAGYLRTEMLLAHGGWTVVLDQPDGSVVDAVVLPFRPDAPHPGLDRWVGSGARVQASREAAEPPSEAGAGPLAASGLDSAVWGRVSPTPAPSGGARAPHRRLRATSSRSGRGAAAAAAAAATELGHPLIDGGDGTDSDAGRGRQPVGRGPGPSGACFHRHDLHSRPVVICSNPNGGSYELWHRFSETMDFLLASGFTIVVWNYRGYGRSTGVPSPQRCIADAAALASYARRHLGATTILAHGESIGGTPATGLVASGAADGLLADRNFDTLDKTARAMMGEWAAVGMRALSSWAAVSNARAVLAADCPKVLVANLTDDEVIALPASLAGNVARLTARAWQERAGPLPSPPSAPLPPDPSRPRRILPSCLGKPAPPWAAADDLGSLARALQLALGRAFMASAHRFCGPETLGEAQAARDVRFHGASLRRSAGGGGRGGGIVAVEPAGLLLRRTKVAHELGGREPNEALRLAQAEHSALLSPEERSAIEARLGPAGIAAGAAASAAAGSVPPAPTPSSDDDASATAVRKRPSSSSDAAPGSPRGRGGARPSSSAPSGVRLLTADGLADALPLALGRGLPPWFVDPALAGAGSVFARRAAMGMALPFPEALDTAAAASLEELCRTGADIKTHAAALRESAFPGAAALASRILAHSHGDAAAAVSVAVAMAETGAGTLAHIVGPRLLGQTHAAETFLAVHAVYVAPWASDAGMDAAVGAAGAASPGTVPRACVPLSAAQRLACGLPLRPGAAHLGPSDPVPRPVVPAAAAAEDAVPVAALPAVVAVARPRLSLHRSTVSLHAAVCVATALSELLPLDDDAALDAMPGATEALAVLAVARRVIEAVEWVAAEGGPRRHLDAALEGGRSGHGDAFASLASRALREEGVLVAVPGTGHNAPWGPGHLAMVRGTGARLGWWGDESR